MFTVKNKSVVLASVLTVLMVLAGCATNSASRVPDWVLDNNGAFDTTRYITAVGEGSTMQQAQADATQALARILQQQVQATTVANRTMTDHMGDIDISKSLDQMVHASTDISITGMRIQENFCHTDANTGVTTWYALALLDREIAGAWYEEQVIQNEEQVMSMQAASASAELNHQGFTAIQLMRTAEQYAVTADEQIAILSVLSMKRYNTVLPVWQSSDTVKAQRIRLEKSLVFGVSIKDDYDQRIAKAVQSVFADQHLDCTLDPNAANAGTFTGELTITPFDSVNAQNNKYVRYTLTGSLVDDAGTELLPLTITGREAHVTTEEATQRAVRTVEKELKKQLGAALSKELQ